MYTPLVYQRPISCQWFLWPLLQTFIKHIIHSCVKTIIASVFLLLLGYIYKILMFVWSFFLATITANSRYARFPLCFEYSRPPYNIFIGGGYNFLVIIVLLIRNTCLSLLGSIILLRVIGCLIIVILIISIYARFAPFIWARVFYNLFFWFF